jgi:hypothetical protein
MGITKVILTEYTISPFIDILFWRGPNGKQTMITSFPLHTSQCYLRLTNSSLKGDQKPFLKVVEASLAMTEIIILAVKLTPKVNIPILFHYFCLEHL